MEQWHDASPELVPAHGKKGSWTWSANPPQDHSFQWACPESIPFNQDLSNVADVQGRAWHSVHAGPTVERNQGRRPSAM